ncbi:MAG: hypothetical protein GXN95_00915 [Methanococci archaeon]|nr:hypothetical protein [Methanococci archaeon]
MMTDLRGELLKTFDQLDNEFARTYSEEIVRIYDKIMFALKDNIKSRYGFKLSKPSEGDIARNIVEEINKIKTLEVGPVINSGATGLTNRLSNIQKQLDKASLRLDRKIDELSAKVKQLEARGKRKLLEGDTEGASMIASQVAQLRKSLKLLETYRTAMGRQIARIEGLKETIGILAELKGIIKIDLNALNSEEARKVKEQLLGAKNVINQLEETLLGLEDMVKVEGGEVGTVLSSDEKNVMMQWLEEIKSEVSSYEPTIEEKLNEIEKKIETQSI